MKLKLTYKEFTLIIGIAVAMIIVLTLWLRPASAEANEVSGKFSPSISRPSAKAVADQVVFAIIDTVTKFTYKPF